MRCLNSLLGFKFISYDDCVKGCLFILIQSERKFGHVICTKTWFSPCRVLDNRDLYITVIDKRYFKFM